MRHLIVALTAAFLLAATAALLGYSARPTIASTNPVAEAFPVAPPLFKPATPRPTPRVTPQDTSAEAVERPAPVARLPRGELKWENAYQDNFDDAECVKRYVPLQNGELKWHEKHKGLLLENNQAMGEIYAVVHKSLPGDLRVRFRALRRKSADQVSIGIVLSCKGALRAEDGYFVEWANGYAKIKKHDELMTDGSAPTPQTAERWVNLEVRRVDATITMFMEGKQVLEWTDPQPLNASAHDLFSFYVWGEKTIIDDLTIDRNANDPLKPLPDDPATEANIQGMARPTVDSPLPMDF